MALALEKLPAEVQWIILRNAPRGLMPFYRLVSKAWQRIVDAFLLEVGWPSLLTTYHSCWRSRRLFELMCMYSDGAFLDAYGHYFVRRGVLNQAILEAACGRLDPWDLAAMSGQCRISIGCLRKALIKHKLPLDWLARVAKVLFPNRMHLLPPERHKWGPGVTADQVYCVHDDLSDPLQAIVVADDPLKFAVYYQSHPDSPIGYWSTLFENLAVRCLAWLLAQACAVLSSDDLIIILYVATRVCSFDCTRIFFEYMAARGRTPEITRLGRWRPSEWRYLWLILDTPVVVVAKEWTNLYAHLWSHQPQPSVVDLERIAAGGYSVDAAMLTGMFASELPPIDAKVVQWLTQGGLDRLLANLTETRQQASTVQWAIHKKAQEPRQRTYSRANWTGLQKLAQLCSPLLPN